MGWKLTGFRIQITRKPNEHSVGSVLAGALSYSTPFVAMYKDHVLIRSLIRQPLDYQSVYTRVAKK